MTIKLTDTERLILSNQYEILAAVSGADLAAQEHYDALADNLRQGHAYLYRGILQQVQPEFTADQTAWLVDVLAMYGALKQSHAELSGDRTDVVTYPLWPGFDTNSEMEWLSYSRALHAAHLYTDVLGENLKGAHGAMAPRYSRMLARWDEMGKSQSLDLQQYNEIMSTRSPSDD